METMGRRTRLLAGVLLGYAAGGATAAVVLGAMSGEGWAWLVEGFVVTNTVTGSALAVAGWPVARHRPANPVGWLLLTAGCLFLTSAGGLALLALVQAEGGTSDAWRVVGTAVNTGFAWPVAFAVPLALLLFPDGRFASPAWRLSVAPLGAGLGAMLLASLLDPSGSLAGGVGYPDLVPSSGPRARSAVDAVATAAVALSYVAALGSLVVRFSRGTDAVRRQVLWVLLAVGVFVLSSAVSLVLPGGGTLWGVVPLVLVPLAMMVAILRHRLLDIRLVVARSVLYAALTGAVLVAYSTFVVMLDWVFRRNVPGGPAVAALAIALAFTPVREVLQGWVDRLLYGERGDPVRVLHEIGPRLGAAVTDTGFDQVVESLCRSLRLPAAAITINGDVAAVYGRLPAARHVVHLHRGDTLVGELVLGLRRGEDRLAGSDAEVIALLTAPIATAVGAASLAAEVEAARQRVVSAREEERRRLRRDLHDGLGPRLTGVVLHADAARQLMGTDPRRAGELLDELRDQAGGTVDEIRRLVYDLRPPSLDGMGLAGALDAYALTLTRRVDGAPLQVDVETTGPTAHLPAAVEVAAYRIVTEALTNVARHSSARGATVQLASDGSNLRIAVQDDGSNADRWRPGVGLTSIQERAAELRGTSEVSGTPSGGRVHVVLPLDGASP